MKRGHLYFQNLTFGPLESPRQGHRCNKPETGDHWSQSDILLRRPYCRCAKEFRHLGDFHSNDEVRKNSGRVLKDITTLEIADKSINKRRC